MGTNVSIYNEINKLLCVYFQIIMIYGYNLLKNSDSEIGLMFHDMS